MKLPALVGVVPALPKKDFGITPFAEQASAFRQLVLLYAQMEQSQDQTKQVILQNCWRIFALINL
jgi:hypothetical protein